jgi:predicted TIM-barrel fold metal-dependent hydrolase
MGSAVGQTARPADPVPTVPLVDHHQHLFSPATAALISEAQIDGRALIGHLDDAGIARAVVLSVAYTWGKPDRAVENEYDQVRATNDWTSEQVARFPDRLRGFCGVNPLRDYALDELARCAGDRHLRHVAHGLKLHLGNSAVDYRDPQHVARVQRILRAANGYGMPIVVHVRASISRRLPYGRDAARVFLDELLPAAPDVPVQIAHLCGAGGYADDPPVDAALSVFVEAIAGRDPRVGRLLFDVTNAVSPGAPRAERALIARRIRALGVERVLYGSDAALPGNTPRECWEVLRSLPLSQAEFRTIAGNVAPYMR